MDKVVKAFIDLLETNIEAESSRSSACKNWSVSLLTGFIVLCKATDTKPNYLILIAPIFLLACLDAYYLGTEGWYRDTYNDFVNKAKYGNYSSAFVIEERDWSTGIKHGFKKFLSPSVLCFYVGLAVVSSILAYIFNYGG